VIYGIMTETNIGKLFAAGVLPGILATLLLCLAVQYVTWRDPKAGPPGERVGWRERWAALAGLQWFAAVGVILAIVVHFGWLESDDAAVVGAFVVFLMSLHYKGVSSVIALFVAGDGRHLRRRVHRGRRRGRGRLRRIDLRARAAARSAGASCTRRCSRARAPRRCCS
jgi:hypothetical protein